MTVEISVKGALEPTTIAGSFMEFINDMNLAAAKGKQFVICTEQRLGGDTNQVAFDTRNITRIRELENTYDAFANH